MTEVPPPSSPASREGLGESLLALLSGPTGTRAVVSDGSSRAGWRRVLAVLLIVTSCAMALGALTKTVCAQDDWDDAGLASSRLCGSQIADAYLDDGLVELTWPWTADSATLGRYVPADRPALEALWGYAAARVTHLLSGSPDVGARGDQPVEDVAVADDVTHERSLFVAVNAVGLAAVALLIVVLLAGALGSVSSRGSETSGGRGARRSPWDAVVVAGSPLLVVLGLVSWELLAVGLVTAGVCVLTRSSAPRSALVAGALLGAGVAASWWAVWVVVAIVLLAVRTRTWHTVLRVCATGLSAWLLVNLPGFASDRGQWRSAVAGSLRDQVGDARVDSPSNGSIWWLLDQVVGVPDGVLLPISLLLIGTWVAVVAAVVVLAPRRPELADVVLLVVGGVLVLSVHVEAQQALWLLPLAALAPVRWRHVVTWQAAVLLMFALTTWAAGGYLDPGRDGPPAFAWFGVLAHAGATVWVVARVVGQVLRPDAARSPRSDAVAPSLSR
ncbi:hypothetical protein [Nocardioides sp. R-C-SC26]|uniref:hypothetical protein n=1 Tax=Nocardioides sp. R-C-SC26 TaxID=2870414 RepID=UPI001E5774DA|nr:hypothetical protein [Nocardioides sp. R-C-SC26]